jgi:hypothetical protein
MMKSLLVVETTWAVAGLAFQLLFSGGETIDSSQIAPADLAIK